MRLTCVIRLDSNKFWTISQLHLYPYRKYEFYKIKIKCENTYHLYYSHFIWFFEK